MKRQRGRNRRSSGGQNNNINRHFESNGPDVKIRGSAQQVLEKYLQYAREAQTNGDRVKSEAYFQHAEHYQRTLAIMQANQKPKRDRDDARNRDQDQAPGESEANADSATGAGDQPDDRVSADSDDGAETKANGSAKPQHKDDPLRVIGDDDAVATAKTTAGKADTDAEADAGDGEKPKRTRRRTYKKKSSEDGDAASSDTGGDDSDSGVMKTLSRGRKPAKASSDEGAETDSDRPQQAAAE